MGWVIKKGRTLVVRHSALCVGKSVLVFEKAARRLWQVKSKMANKLAQYSFYGFLFILLTIDAHLEVMDFLSCFLLPPNMHIEVLILSAVIHTKEDGIGPLPQEAPLPLCPPRIVFASGIHFKLSWSIDLVRFPQVDKVFQFHASLARNIVSFYLD